MTEAFWTVKITKGLWPVEKKGEYGRTTPPAHTHGHLNCPACAAFQILPSKVAMGQTVRVAGDVWLKSHESYLKPNTVRSYRQYVAALGAYFGDLPLEHMHIGNVRAYQAERKVCATRMNSELSALQMICKEAGCWDRIFPLYRPRPIPQTKVRQNMSEEEEQRLIVVALDKPKRRLAGHCLLVMANTSAGFGELRNVTRREVVLNEDIPYMEVNGGAKNDYRKRVIPLNFIALRSMRWIIKRWEALGGKSPDSYILPHRARTTGGDPIFTEPMGHIYRAARGILNDAGLGHLDPYDMRSHAITKILSDSSVSEQTYKEIVGHVSKRMRDRYSSQRMQTKAKAVEAMCKKPPQPEHPRPQLLMFQGGKRG